MEKVKKMILIDPTSEKNVNAMATKTNTPERLMTPIKREISELDGNLLEIINNSDLNEEEKVTWYNQTLAKFQKLYNMKRQSPINADVRSEKSPSSDLKLWGIPPQYTKKAQTLLDFIQTKTDLDVGVNGNVAINGQQIANSNIVDLIHKAVTPRSRLHSLQGWQEFKKFLEKNNTPQSMLATDFANSSLAPSKLSTSIKKSKPTLATPITEPKASPKKRKYTQKSEKWIKF